MRVLPLVIETPDPAQPKPWRSYHRNRLRSGLSFPVRLGEVETALRGGRVTISQLVFTVPLPTRQSGPRRTELLRAIWDDGESSLWLSASPADDHERAHDLLIQEGLPKAVAWLGQAAGRGNVWTAGRHRWTLRLVEGGLIVDQVDGQIDERMPGRKYRAPIL